MSTQIDERVVEMRFDNRHFENNVQTSMSTLEKLKQRLNLSGASKGLETVGQAAGKVDTSMAGLSSAVDTVRMRFSALEVMAVTTLANITNSAVNAGKRMISALTIDPIKTGFSEYETQINAVQTILANTSHAGTTMDDVNVALDTLNKYADKTIYNFTEMTRNIGTFTAAGVDLDTSVKSIQGIANLAAVSGSTSQQASTAMYQLSQALAAGRVSLMDWNSVVNAGMGGKVFQDALIRTSEMMGTGAQDAIDKFGSFRESLTQGEWLTTDVLTKTLEQFTMAAEEGSEEWNTFKKSLMEEGYTEEQATEILKMANTATDAATKVKTFTQLWDTLKEAAQSGWTQTWEILIGDFEEAKEMLTNISNVVGDFINKTAEARNNLLQGWKDEGGRTDLIESLANTFKFLGEVIKPVTEAFREVFPALKVEQLTAITDGLLAFSEKLKLSADTSEKLKTTFKGVFSIISIMGKALGVVATAVWELITSEGMAKLATFLLDIAAAIGNFFTKINEGFDSNGLIGVLSGIVGFISDIFGTAVGHIETFGDLVAAVGDVILNVATKIWEGLKTVFGWISETFSAKDLFAGLAGGGIFVAAKNIAGFFKDFDIVDTIKGVLGMGGDNQGSGGPKMLDQIKDVLGGVSDSLNAFTTSVKISSLVSIAVAIGVLSASLKTISGIDTAGVVKSLAAMGLMMQMLSMTFSSISDTLSQSGSGGIVKAGVSLILIATALNILSGALEKIGGLSFPEIVKGLIGIGGGLTALCIGLKSISKSKVSLSTSIAILALAEACDILGDALQKFGSMGWDEIKRGLAGMGGALTELVVAVSVLNKTGGFKSLLGSASIAIVVQSLDDMAEGLKKFGEMSWNEIKQGLAAMGGALAELVISLGLLGKVAGFSSIFAAGSIAIVVQSLDEMAVALDKFGTMTWDEIGRGLAAMGGALGELVIALGLLGTVAGFSSIFAAGSIAIVTQSLDEIATALQTIGDLSWDNIKIGLTGMGGALAELAIVSGALGILAGFSGLLGSGSILIAVQGLGDLADALQKFGTMTWDEIGRGLVAMGGALAEVAVVSGALGALAGLPALLGGGAILLAVQGLGDLADALQKFGEMSWDEIGRGLSAMAGALGETALGGLLNTFSGFGANAISEMAGSLGVLADSVKKWAGVTVPEGLSTQLESLAEGVKKFTFAGMGAEALAASAAGVGTLADSAKKWTGVVIPEGLGDKMKTLADGVEKFSLAGIGASALADAAPAIGKLADGLKKWKDVSIPDNLESDLKAVANGVKAFSFAFAGGWSLGTLVGPLGKLSDSIKKWVGVDVPDNVEGDLKSVARGVKAFADAFAGGWSLSAVVGPIGDLAGSMKKWDGVSVPEGLGDRLKSFANGLKAMPAATKVSDLASALDKLTASIKKFSGVDFKSLSSKIGNSITSAVDKAVKSIRGKYSDFKNAAKYLVEGFANSITNNQWRAYNAAYAMGRVTIEALKEALRVESPSKEAYEVGDFTGIGFVNALHDYESVAHDAGYDVGNAARIGLNDAARKINDLLISEDSLTPTIRPVLDLSEVRSGASDISSMLRLGSSVGVMANVNSIGSIMSRMNQNGGNSDVVSALKDLGKKLGKTSGDTYHIDGVNVSDDAEVANAIRVLTRAAIRERRV